MADLRSESERAEQVRAALYDAVTDLDGSFATDELAYLAVTSKVEQPIRDRLAWALHRALGDEFTVSREWRRADLAVLRSDSVVAQLEAKALYSFDVLSPASRQAYIARLLGDAAKMSALIASDRYLLSIVVDVQGDIRTDLRRHVVKYAAGIAARARSAGPSTTRSAACASWQQELAAAFGCAPTKIEVAAGRVWGLDVGVDLFLAGPLTGSAVI